MIMNVIQGLKQKKLNYAEISRRKPWHHDIANATEM